MCCILFLVIMWLFLEGLEFACDGKLTHALFLLGNVNKSFCILEYAEVIYLSYLCEMKQIFISTSVLYKRDILVG